MYTLNRGGEGGGKCTQTEQRRGGGNVHILNRGGVGEQMYTH